MSKKSDLSQKSFLVICVVLVVMILLLSIVLALVIRSVRQNLSESADTTVAAKTSKSINTSAPGAATDITTSAISDENTPTTVPESEEPKTDKPATTPTSEEPKTDKPATTPKSEEPKTDKPVTEAPVTTPVIVTEPRTTESTKEPVVPVVPVVREPESSGSFYSTNDQKIKLFVEWNSVRSESGDSADLNVKVYIVCYSIQVGSRTDNKITVNGKSYSFSTPKINEQFGSQSKILIADETVSVDLSDGNTVSLGASWNFKGSYSGVQIDYLEASDVIAIK